jgi:cytosine/uracil/thiamine/allantoin permease
LEVGKFWLTMYDYAWFISFGVAFAVHALIAKRPGQPL